MPGIQELKKPKTDLATMKPKDQVKHLLEQNKTAIAQAIPRHMNPERLMKVAQTAITTTPALLECYVPTLLGGIIQCAQMGLEPNTVLGHAYLVPFFNNKKGRKDAQVIIGYKGLIDLARRSGQVTSIAAHAVRKGDLFEFQYGLEEKLRHIPAEGDRGDITHFYAVAHMKDGGHAFEVMTKAQVEKIRAGTKGNKVWADHFEEMGRKTVIRRLAKYLPLSVEFATGMAQDGQPAPELEVDGSLVAEFSVVDDEGSDDASDPRRDEQQGDSGSAAGAAAGSDSRHRPADDAGNGDGPAENVGGQEEGEPPAGNPQGSMASAPPATSMAQVIASLKACKTVEALDDAASSIDHKSFTAIETKAISAAYLERKAAIEDGPKGGKRGVME